MDKTKDEGSINVPHVLDCPNYDYPNYYYCNYKMVAFFKPIYNKSWKVVIKGWKHHVITSQDGTISLKFEVECTNV